MRAAVVEALGSPPAPADVDDPVRAAGTALVVVEAAPLNPVEIRVAAGRHPRQAQPPYVPALEGRLVNVGQSAGTDVRVPLEVVRNRQAAIHAISSGWTGLDRKAGAYRRVLEHAVAGRLAVDREVVSLDDVATAWEQQGASPGRKLVISIGQRG